MGTKIPTTGIVFWASTHASIPANWTRDNNFALKYFQGDTSAGSTGGGVSHTHTSDNHTHAGNAHNHDLSISGAASGTIDVANTGSFRTATSTHSHSGTKPTYSTTITYNNTAISIGNKAAQPLAMYVIAISPDDANQEIPDNAVVLYDDTSAPTGFHVTDGLGGTVDMDDKFLLGATEPSGNGGVDNTGTPTHDHALTDHTHSVNAHSHTNSQFPKTTTLTRTIIPLGFLSGALIPPDFHHYATNIGNDSTGISTDAVTINSASNEPAFHQLLGIQNISGSASTPNNVIIALKSGSVPSGWIACDGTNGTPDLSAVQIKVTGVGANVGTTGGSNTHTHTTNSHGHTHSSSHIHTYTFGVTTQSIAFGTTTVTSSLHIHTSNTMASTTPTLQNATATMSSDDVRLSYRTVIWIKQQTVVADNVAFFGANF